MLPLSPDQELSTKGMRTPEGTWIGPRGYIQVGGNEALPPTTLCHCLPGAGPGGCKGSSALLRAIQAPPSQPNMMEELASSGRCCYPPPHTAIAPCLGIHLLKKVENSWPSR